MAEGGRGWQGAQRQGGTPGWRLTEKQAG
eukprot:SAG22_NODE_9234_length_601_cov_1.420319_2_plen_28_part_01